MSQVEDVMGFVLVLVRTASVIAFLPFLEGGAVPRAIKGLLALAVSLCLYPVVDAPTGMAAWRPLEFALHGSAEVLFGALLGTCALIIFRALRTGGGMIGQQMGMALAAVADPISNVQSTFVGQFCEVVGVLVFFALGAHLAMFRALHESFVQVPLGQFMSAEFLRQVSVAAVAQSLAMGFRLAAPLLLLTFTISLVMALMARLVPEVNVLIIGFPLRVGVGLVGLALFVPVLVGYSGDVVRLMVTFMSGVAGSA